jgi:hypothetical protein
MFGRKCPSGVQTGLPTTYPRVVVWDRRSAPPVPPSRQPPSLRQARPDIGDPVCAPAALEDTVGPPPPTGARGSAPGRPSPRATRTVTKRDLSVPARAEARGPAARSGREAPIANGSNRISAGAADPAAMPRTEKGAPMETAANGAARGQRYARHRQQTAFLRAWGCGRADANGRNRDAGPQGAAVTKPDNSQDAEGKGGGREGWPSGPEVRLRAESASPQAKPLSRRCERVQSVRPTPAPRRR